MRILEIRFANLNSLVGEWRIDLTHPAFVAEGIFAITGPTGAGKTTILDAICLALYGRTPRLERINKTGNDVMAKHCGSCFAEVTFETQAGVFRCHWSQHRARKKADGELQSTKHEISDGSTGKVIENKVRRVAGRIESVTGMDFERFTRSMLLAQGEFAAFLQAEPDSRSPLLEQITGTEIYSRISVRVHERHADERKKLQGLELGLASIQLLSDEERELLTETLAQRVEEDASLGQRIDQLQSCTAWLKGMDALEAELKSLHEQQAELLRRSEDFAPDREKLQLANRAFELRAEFREIVSMRKEQGNDQQNLQACQEAMPALREQKRKLDENVARAAADLAGAKEDQARMHPLLQTVRMLDTNRAAQAVQVEAQERTVSDAAEALVRARTLHEETENRLSASRAELVDLQRDLEAHATDARLVEELAGLEQRFENLQNTAARASSKSAELQKASKTAEAAKKLWKERLEQEANGRATLEAVRRESETKRETLQRLLKGDELSTWHDRVRSIREEIAALGELRRQARDLRETRTASETLTRTLEALRLEEKSREGTLGDLVARKRDLEAERDLLESELERVQQIASFEEARLALRDGESCPLCGAKEHPYAAGHFPEPNDTRRRLIEVRNALKELDGALSNHQRESIAGHARCEQHAERLKELSSSIAAASSALRDLCRSRELDPEAPDLLDRLESLHAREQQELSAAEQTITMALEHSRNVRELDQRVEKEKETLHSIQHHVQSAQHESHSARETVERLTNELEQLRLERERNAQALLHDLEPFGIRELLLEDATRCLGELTLRRDTWVARREKRVELQRTIEMLELELKHQESDIRRSELQLKESQLKLETLIRERDCLQQERNALFGDRDPDKEEARTTAAIEEAATKYESVRKEAYELEQAQVQQVARVEELQRSIESRASRLRAQEETFHLQLRAAGFADEDEYENAMLPDEERKELGKKADELDRESARIQALVREKQQRLVEEQEKSLTDETYEDLRQQLNATQERRRECQQDIGRIGQRLESDQELRRQHAKRVGEIEAQKREVSRWELLYDLIGSADGKKFRNFAQGLTFDAMIGLANRQLQKMSDRYVLVRDESQLLSLNVIDGYQGGEIRSTKNLSGGESFIVSLALALGLSQMSSRNIRIDSLFLDEGFGTLDDESLEIALDTLAGLRQDGKLIGVISHVQALKDRISTQIQVVPQLGGKSKLAGPGCEAVLEVQRQLDAVLA